MPLVDVRLSLDRTPIPGDVRSLVREANRRIEDYQQHCRVPGFVASDFERSYAVLRALTSAGLVQGNLFCEWGSGFGVVACLAAMLDFDACGIEIEDDLVDEAQGLANDFGLPVEFLRGSFIPRGAVVHADAEAAAGFAWLTAEEGRAHEDLGLDPDDFDIIFAYPWPDEEDVTEKLFKRYAAAGALLVSYHGGDQFRVRRKVGRK